MGFRAFFVLATLVVFIALSEASKCIRKCPSGYTFHQPSGKCFKLYRMPKGQPAGWSNYRRACQSLPPKEWRIRAADLASIHGGLDQNMTLEIAKPLGKASVWIGLHQVGSAWQWTDGSKFGVSPFWAPGRPDGLPKQDCVKVNLPHGHWDDVQCEAQAIGGAICQVVSACINPRVATPKPTPKRTKAPRRTTVRRRPTPKATRRPPPSTHAATPKPTPKRTQPPRRTTRRRRSSPKATRRPSSPSPVTTSPKLVSSKKPEVPKPTTSKPRECPCRKHKTTAHPPQPEVTAVPTKKPDGPKESTEKPRDCGEPPKKPQGPNEPEEPHKKPVWFQI